MRRTWKLGLQLLVMWSFPALFFASQAWFAMAGGGQQAAPVTLLVGTLASWYLWAAATPLVLHLVERWPPTIANYRWMGPHAACAGGLAILRTAFELLYLLPSAGLPLTMANMATGLRANLPFGLLLNLLIYCVVVAFGNVALRESAHTESDTNAG